MNTMQTVTRDEIFEFAHRGLSADLCRKYWKQSGIKFEDLKMSDFEDLKSKIQSEIDSYLADPEYRIIKGLRVKDKIIRNKDGIFLRIKGSYFSDREGISFNTHPLFIGFCIEMDGCNHTPFVRGFVNWVDSLKGSNSTGLGTEVVG